MEVNSKRSPNFTEEEISLLVELVTEEENFKVLKQEGGDLDFNKRKKGVWVTITNSLNAVCKNGREKKQITEKWSQLVGAAKKTYRAHKRYADGTGGGPAPPEPRAHVKRIIELYADTAKFNGVIEEEIGEGGVLVMKANSKVVVKVGSRPSKLPAIGE